MMLVEISKSSPLPRPKNADSVMVICGMNATMITLIQTKFQKTHSPLDILLSLNLRYVLLSANKAKMMMMT